MFNDRIETDFASGGSSGPAVGVFVSPEYAAELKGQLGPLPRIMLHALEVPTDQPIPEQALAGIAVAVIEVEPFDRKSIDRLVRIARQRHGAEGGIPVIAAVADADVGLVRTLLREGIADVITLPINADELTTAALDALARRAQTLQPTVVAPLICVARTRGGCGATTVATHLASALAGRDWRGKGVLLADLDVQFGSVAPYLDLARSSSFLDLIEARDRIDPFLLASMAGDPAAGLAVIAAPQEIHPLDGLPVDAVVAVMEQLRRHYGLVVVDLPAGWTNWSASLAASADLVLLVVDQSLSSLRQAGRGLHLFSQPGLSPERIEVVVNRLEKSMFKPISTRTIAETLGREPIGALPDAGDAITRAQDRGELLEGSARRVPFVAAMNTLADAVERILKPGAQT